MTTKAPVTLRHELKHQINPMDDLVLDGCAGCSPGSPTRAAMEAIE